jgi:diacylglycerol O-acyltransferase
MRQLSEHDAAFIYSDTAHANSNVTLLHIYDQSTAPGGVASLQANPGPRGTAVWISCPISARRSCVFRSTWTTPTGLKTTTSTLSYHVHHIALPKPGDWRQFCIQTARIHARPLDLNRPLWEMYVIEGLDSFLDLPVGSFAVLLKVHHAAIDVAHGNEITKLLHDLTPAAPRAVSGCTLVSRECAGQFATLLAGGRQPGPVSAAHGAATARQLDTLKATARTLPASSWACRTDFP